MADEDFVFTDHMVTVSNQLWMITAAVGACMCFIVLVLIGVMAIHPVSRTHLDRVSFRILTYALMANMVFGIVNAVGGSFTGPTWACGFTIWLLQLTLELSSFLIFCIALNLQLVVVHRVNGQRMERFYVAGSVCISLALTIPPYAAKQYGWDPLVQDCWYSNDNPKQRLAWQIGTQLFWTLLTVVGEVCTSITVIICMIKRRPKFLQVTTSSTTRPRAGSISDRHAILANKYRNVLWRIGLYPFASCVINATSVMCVLHATVTDGVHDMNQYRILLLSDFLYGGRAVVYALLAATDPAFLSAWRALLSHERSSSSRFTTLKMGYPSIAASRQHRTNAIEIELTTTIHRDHDTELGKSPSVPKDSSLQLGKHILPSVQDIPSKLPSEAVPAELRDYTFVSGMSQNAEAENEIQQNEFRKRI